MSYRRLNFETNEIKGLALNFHDAEWHFRWRNLLLRRSMAAFHMTK